jgi:hypothetical protein
MREQVIQVVEQYIDPVRRNDASALPLHPDAVLRVPTDACARTVEEEPVTANPQQGRHCTSVLRPPRFRIASVGPDARGAEDV